MAVDRVLFAKSVQCEAVLEHDNPFSSSDALTAETVGLDDSHISLYWPPALLPLDAAPEPPAANLARLHVRHRRCRMLA